MTGAEAEAELARAVVKQARSWIGTPYRHQASRKGVGCDCLGLLLGVWRELYGEPPEDPGPYSADWAEAGGRDRLMDAAHRNCRECPTTQLHAGKIVLFRWRRHLPAKHIGILMRPDAFIHAYEGHGVLISALVPQWRRRIAAVFAFPLRSWT